MLSPSKTPWLCLQPGWLEVERSHRTASGHYVPASLQDCSTVWSLFLGSCQAPDSFDGRVSWSCSAFDGTGRFCHHWFVCLPLLSRGHSILRDHCIHCCSLRLSSACERMRQELSTQTWHRGPDPNRCYAQSSWGRLSPSCCCLELPRCWTLWLACCVSDCECA